MRSPLEIDWRIACVLFLIAIMGTFTVISITTNLAFSLSNLVFIKALELRVFVGEHFVLSAVFYILSYTAAVVLCLPVLIPWTIVGGFFFDFWGLPFAVLALASGASLFLMFSDKRLHQFAEHALLGKRLDRLRGLYQKSSLLWVFVLRLFPILPFFLVTVAAAVFPTRIASFFWGTVLGTLPGAFIYVWIGRSVSMIELIDNQLNFSHFIANDTLIPAFFILVLTVGLAIFARRL